jgi:1-acyl-sn-glycerol-3-phosphate acyltransferase
MAINIIIAKHTEASGLNTRFSAKYFGHTSSKGIFCTNALYLHKILSQHMEKHSKAYAFYKWLLTPYYKWFWHQEIVIKGEENIPWGKPVIFAPNHQNALMDATALIWAVEPQIVFLARSDIFKGGKIRAILNFMRIMPVYRIRDGAESLGKNEEIFRKSAKILSSGIPLALFPEAQHWGLRKLRGLKKGLARIAFTAESQNSFQLNCNIVPVSIYYDNYRDFRKNIVICFGAPINTSNYTELYKHNDNRALADISNSLSRSMKGLMMHISTDKYYQEAELLRQSLEYYICTRRKLNKKSAYGRYQASMEAVGAINRLTTENEDAFIELSNLCTEYQSLLKSLKTDHRIVSEGPAGLKTVAFAAATLPLAIPFFAAGMLSNYPTKALTDNFVKHNIKDPQFARSFSFALGVFVLPINYALFAASCWAALPIGGAAAALLLIAAPAMGVFAHEYSVFAKYVTSSMRFRAKKKSQTAQLKQKYTNMCLKYTELSGTII